MLRVRDIMTADVTTVSPETSLRDAMDLFARSHVSGAPVVSGNTVVGVVSTSDLMGFAATLASRASDGESPEWDEFAEAAVGAELTDDDDAAGAFFSDLWSEPAEDLEARMAPANRDWAALDGHDVSEVMTRGTLWSLPSSSDARLAASMMREHGIHRVLVIDDNELVGIVTATDITRAVADHRFTIRSVVFERG